MELRGGWAPEQLLCSGSVSSPAQTPVAVPAPAQLLPSECLTLSHCSLSALLQLQPSFQVLPGLCSKPAASSGDLGSSLCFPGHLQAPWLGSETLARQTMLPARQCPCGEPWQLPWEIPLSSRGLFQGHCRASPASPGAQRWLLGHVLGPGGWEMAGEGTSREQGR